MALMVVVMNDTVPPVLFIVFNRPDTTAKVFESIRMARPPRLYIAADGARERPGEKELCLQVRRITENVDWPCEVHRLYRDENLGCKKAVSSAITWFLDNEEEGIILEDDCLPDLSFFSYCQVMLDRYRDDARVMMVSGNDHTLLGRHRRHDYYFNRYAQIWGWATWRRAWQKYDITMSAWPYFNRCGDLRKRIRHKAMARHLAKCFELTCQGKIETWDYQWTFTCLLNDGLSICPHGNLISNIGFDGTHMEKDKVGRLLDLSRTPFDTSAIRHPRAVAPDRSTQRAVYRAVLNDAYPRGWVGRLDQFIYRTWLRIRPTNDDQTSEQ